MRNPGSHFKAAALLTALAIVGSGAAVTAQDEESKTIGFVPPALTSPFHVAMADGATHAGEELGWTVDVQAPTSEGDFAAFVTTVQQLLEKGVDGLSINPIGTDSAVTAVKAANEKGVPIIAHNFITPFSEGDVALVHRVRPVGRRREAGCPHLRAPRRQERHDGCRDAPARSTSCSASTSIFSHRRTGGFKAGLRRTARTSRWSASRPPTGCARMARPWPRSPGRLTPRSMSSTATATRWPSEPPWPASSWARRSTRTSSRSASTATRPRWTCSRRASSAPRSAWTR